MHTKVISIGEPLGEKHSSELPQEISGLRYGGDCLNVIFHLASLVNNSKNINLSLSFLSQVGRDEYSETLFKGLQDLGVDTTMVRQIDGEMASYLAQVNPDGSKNYQFTGRDISPARTMFNDRNPDQILENCSLIYSSMITATILDSAEQRKALIDLYSKARDKDIYTVFDTNYRIKLEEEMWGNVEKAQEFLAEIIPFVDLLLPGNEDISHIYGYEIGKKLDMIEHLAKLGAKRMILKCGADGYITYSPEGPIIGSMAPVSVTGDTTAAGDYFNAGVIKKLLETRELDNLEVLAESGQESALQALKIQGSGIVFN